MHDDARPPQPPTPTPPDLPASRPPHPDTRAGRIRLLIAAAALLLIASLVGVLASGHSPFSLRSHTTGAGSSRAPADKQILREVGIGVNAGDLDALDPAHIQYGTDYDKGQLVFPELITLDDEGKVVDWAAQRHEVSSDGLTYTFHLHSGMQWSDGAPIDANTFAYSINRALDPCTGSEVASYLYNLTGASDFNRSDCRPEGAVSSVDTLMGKSIVVADPLTLKLTLEAPAAYFLGAFTYSTSWAVPKQLIDKYADKWTNHLADGSGFGGNLYKVTRWDHAGHFELSVNDTFWGQKPILQKINWALYQELNTAWADYKVGVGDVGFPSPSDLAYSRTLPGYSEVPALSVRYLRLNWALAPFDDVRVRNAFSLAIDRTALATAVSKGSAAPTIHMIIQGLPGYNPTLKNAAGDSGDKANVANVAKAQELAKAYAAEKCSGNYAKCAPIVYTYATIASTESLRAQALQQMWQTAFPGWPITLQGLNIQVLHKTAAKLQLSFGGWSADYPDPQDFISLLWAKDAQYNSSAVDVSEADALEQQADVSSDATGRLAQYQQAEQLLINQGAFIAYEQPLFVYVVRSDAKLVKWQINALKVTALRTWQQAYIAV
jgi:oligopeptide transport system substrate-binding protein